jgi:hypothetical protein
MLVSPLAEVFLDRSDISNILHILVFCWVQCHILSTDCKSLQVFVLVSDVYHEWYDRRMFLHKPHLQIRIKVVCLFRKI